MGIFAGIVPLFRSPVTLAVSQADFSLPSLHPKIPFPATGSTSNTIRQPGNIGESLEAKTPFRARSVIIADSVRGLRTAGSILQGHHEVARLQCRAVDDLRPLL